MPTIKLHKLVPKDLVHQYLSAHSQASGIPLSKLLEQPAFRASVEQIVTELTACYCEIIEQGIESEATLALYRARE